MEMEKRISLELGKRSPAEVCNCADFGVFSACIDEGDAGSGGTTVRGNVRRERTSSSSSLCS